MSDGKTDGMVGVVTLRDTRERCLYVASPWFQVCGMTFLAFNLQGSREGEDGQW